MKPISNGTKILTLQGWLGTIVGFDRTTKGFHYRIKWQEMGAMFALGSHLYEDSVHFNIWVSEVVVLTGIE